MAEDVRKIVEIMSKEKGLPKDVIISALVEGMRTAAKKRLGSQAEVEAIYNEEEGKIEVYRLYEVVEEVHNPEKEISLAEARKKNASVRVGDTIGEPVNIKDLGRIAAQLTKQILTQKIRGAEKELIYQEYKDKVGQVVSGFVHRFSRKDVILSIGRAEAMLPENEQIPTERYHRGERLKALILEVRRTGDPQIIVSRTHPEFLKKLFEREVPEIREGIVKIVAVAREPGRRAKMAVTSKDPDVDPVGACVGLRGSRVQVVVQELKGEKIDIIPWDPDPAKLVYNALSPAECTQVIVDEENKTLEVIVPDDQLSLAIGREGQNVRLASKLLGWRIDVYSESQYARRQDPEFLKMLEIDGLSEEVAGRLYDNGFKSLKELADAEPEKIAEVGRIKLSEAEELIRKAREKLSAGGDGQG
ncbi:transcription termination factor NusA [Thermosulfurimonas dismutans]|uniref:Transcription termination/antitermination protein NusA n=1 Tax=Thermosulfurimonas dismutans TaxID=999894 RepID=A0A179D369_9BACT|nr:transcription termination factor NusA [Thermosulfurimonas dismutans]OAQ20486.1 Transcription termination protein NusA [Thermosulfurimonas dismutans]